VSTFGLVPSVRSCARIHCNIKSSTFLVHETHQFFLSTPSCVYTSHSGEPKHVRNLYHSCLETVNPDVAPPLWCLDREGRSIDWERRNWPEQSHIHGALYYTMVHHGSHPAAEPMGRAFPAFGSNAEMPIGPTQVPTRNVKY
jgi:hypothetical protein